MKKANIVISIILIIMALVLVPRIATIKEAPGAILGPRFFPYIVLGLIIALSLIVLASAIRNKEDTDEEFINKYEGLKVVITLGLFLVYISVLESVGFIPSTIIFMFALGGFYYGKIDRVIIKIGVFSVLSSFALFYLFSNLFNVALP